MSYFVQKQSRCTTNAFYSVSHFWKLTLRSRSVPLVSAFLWTLSSMLLPRPSALSNKSWLVCLCSVFALVKTCKFFCFQILFIAYFLNEDPEAEEWSLSHFSSFPTAEPAPLWEREWMLLLSQARLLFNYLWWHFHNPTCDYFCPAIRTPIYVVCSPKTPKLTLQLSFFSALFL